MGYDGVRWDTMENDEMGGTRLEGWEQSENVLDGTGRDAVWHEGGRGSNPISLGRYACVLSRTVISDGTYIRWPGPGWDWIGLDWMG